MARLKIVIILMTLAIGPPVRAADGARPFPAGEHWTGQRLNLADGRYVCHIARRYRDGRQLAVLGVGPDRAVGFDPAGASLPPERPLTLTLTPEKPEGGDGPASQWQAGNGGPGEILIRYPTDGPSPLAALTGASAVRIGTRIGPVARYDLAGLDAALAALDLCLSGKPPPKAPRKK